MVARAVPVYVADAGGVVVAGLGRDARPPHARFHAGVGRAAGVFFLRRDQRRASRVLQSAIAASGNAIQFLFYDPREARTRKPFTVIARQKNVLTNSFSQDVTRILHCSGNQGIVICVM